MEYYLAIKKNEIMLFATTWIQLELIMLSKVKKVKVKFAQSYLTLCDPMNCTVHGILQARILEWVAFSFSRGSSQPRDRTQVSRITGRFFTSWATREANKPKTNTIWYRYMWNLKYDTMNLFTEQNQTHRHRKVVVTKGKRGWGWGREKLWVWD